MTRYTIVIDREDDWRWNREGLTLQTVDAFLGEQKKKKRRGRPERIINLCRKYAYLSAGYYCSLLAEARGAWPMPTVADILDLSRKSLYVHDLPDLDEILNKSIARMAEPPEKDFKLAVYFGQSDDPRFKRLGHAAFDTFRYPMLTLSIRKMRSLWRIHSIHPVGIDRVPAANDQFFEDSLRLFARAPARVRKEKKPSLYDLAILYDPNEKLPPSDFETLERFVRAGEAQRMDVELITAKDYHRLGEFDALFIRETTALDNHTFRFARKAEAEGIPVMDDPNSILRCTNKVYLAEILQANNLPAPQTIALNRAAFGDAEIRRVVDEIGFPVVVKIPDGSFSRGIYKAETVEELKQHTETLFKRSRIILAQEYVYTDFDWRIGLLDGKPLYACQYLMSRNHWQIVNHKADGHFVQGGWRTFAIEDVPAEVVETATAAAGLIGDGLYGVDLKMTDKGLYIIEINDNPSIDHTVEDKVLKGALYDTIIASFISRIERM